MKKRKRPQRLSDQLRRLIEDGPMSRYELSKRASVDASQLCRFVQGTGKLTTASLDRIGEVLELEFTVKG